MLSRFSNNKQRIIKNIFSLTILQGANYILPLLTIPYLVRVLGLDIFGLLAFATAFTMYFLIISDYGFNLSATNKIAIYKEDKKKINEIFVSVLSIKFLLVILGFILMMIIVFLTTKLSYHMDIYIYTYGMVVGQALIPLWLFQGMETMKYMTYFNILAKLIATASIFIFIHDKSDYYLVPIFTSLGFIVSGILSLYYAIKVFDLKLYIPSKKSILYYLKDGWHIFINNIFVNLYSTTNTVLLGFLTNNTIVGYYNLAEKIIGAISGLFVPITQALYPYLTRLYEKNPNQYFLFFKKIILNYFFVAIILALLVYIYNNELIGLLASGADTQKILKILNILLIALVLNPLGSLFTQSFIIQNQKKVFFKVVKYTLYTNIILVLPFIYIYGGEGLALAVLLRQIVHILLNIYFLKRVII